jgi:glycosyltransferase involved in cell wall biosynthesis
VSRLIVHSPSALELVRTTYKLPNNIVNQAFVIRHGNYSNCYHVSPKRIEELRVRWHIEAHQTIIVFLGALKPYKGVERLIRALGACRRRDLRLIVAGRPSAQELANNLELAAINDSRIILNLNFIDDDDVAAIYTLADVVAIPFERTLTSGSAVLAMTFGKALILPEQARVLDLANESGAVYFGSDAELAKQLQGLQRDNLHRMGEVNRLSANRFDWRTIGMQTLEAYAAQGLPKRNA